MVYLFYYFQSYYPQSTNINWRSRYGDQKLKNNRCLIGGRFQLVHLWRNEDQPLDEKGCPYYARDGTDITFHDRDEITSILTGFNQSVRALLINDGKDPTKWLNDVNNTYSKARDYERKATEMICSKRRSICAETLSALETDKHKCHIPLRQFIKSLDELKQMQFYRDLKTILQVLPSTRINTLGISVDYIPSLLNWIVISKKYTVPPIEHILVYSLDHTICKIISTKGFNIFCIVVPPSDIVEPTTLNKGFSKKSLMWMVRLLIWRICNYLGYDVISFDTDALAIRNPELLFDKFPDADIMAGQSGFYPAHVQAYWKLKTLNMGTVLLRASLNSSSFWGILSAFSEEQTNININDQKLVNEVLVCLGVHWNFHPLWLTYTNMSKDQIIRENEEMMLGRELIEGRASGLNVIGVPGLLFCRRTCFFERLPEIFVWHTCVKEKRGDIWVLNNNWNEIISYFPNVDKSKIKDDVWLLPLINSTVFEKLPAPCPS
ncbi:unnamed protein product [Owenia fusiformis]|uniref:Uncharacterized protein n=1 Tax=Owenia fusiformis TaxID=6347 RepID=A0A8J1UGD6_OWEFU|nr:unnamed protein product [Owenia fusiformis]